MKRKLLIAKIFSFIFLMSFFFNSDVSLGIENLTYTTKDYKRVFDTGLIKPDREDSQRRVQVPVMGELPESFSWTDKTPIGLAPVKDQANCGSCYSFGTLSQLEDMLRIKYPLYASSFLLSNQAVVSCSRNSKCGGGWFTPVWDYVKEYGVPDETQFPYAARSLSCKSNINGLVKIKDYFYVGEEGKEPTIEELKQALVTYGPLSVTIYAGGAFNNYKSGILNNCSRGLRTNHIVEIVAYSGDTWIVRNSWGSDWGQEGFIQMKMLDSSGRKCNRVGEDATVIELY